MQSHTRQGHWDAATCAFDVETWLGLPTDLVRSTPQTIRTRSEPGSIAPPRSHWRPRHPTHRSSCEGRSSSRSLGYNADGFNRSLAVAYSRRTVTSPDVLLRHWHIRINMQFFTHSHTDTVIPNREISIPTCNHRPPYHKHTSRFHSPRFMYTKHPASVIPKHWHLYNFNPATNLHFTLSQFVSGSASKHLTQWYKFLP